jgi:hypothetical protein
MINFSRLSRKKDFRSLNLIKSGVIIIIISKLFNYVIVRGNLTGRKKRVENWTVHLRVCVVSPPFSDIFYRNFLPGAR